MKPLVKMLRLRYMPVVLGPQYLGFVLADRRLLPELTPDALVRAAAAMMALGPLLWGGTLLLNDACDLSADRCNPRRSDSPLVRGEVGRRQVLFWAALLKGSGLVLAALVSPGFFLTLLGLAALSWLYSAKPFRLKCRPGLDILVNATGLGALCTVSGWAVLLPLDAFPWAFVLPLMFGWASLYIPTTVVDAAADRRAGLTTFSVRFGNRLAFRLSLASMVFSVFLIYGMAFSRYVLTPGIVYWSAPVAVLQVAAYWVHARRWDCPEAVYRGVVWAAVLGIVLEVLVVMDLTGVIRVGG